ncbi:MAG: hypothetical protein ACW968_11300 [Candidatus Thorarchaeota archaeon]|jgi:hypothetical protein
MKTMRGNNLTDTTRLVNEEGVFIGEESKYDAKYEWVDGLGAVKNNSKDSKREKHQKQLSMYRILLANTHGIVAKDIAVIPIVVNYERGDTKTTTLGLLDIISLDNLNKVKTAELAALTETEQELLETYKTDLAQETERISKGEGNPDIELELKEKIAELESRLSVEEQVESTIEIDKAIEELKVELENLNIKIKGTAPTFEYKQSVETVDDGFTLAFNKYSNAKSAKGKKAAREELIEKYGEKRVARYEAIDSNFNDIVEGITSSGINIFFDSEEGINLQRCK